MEDQKLLKVLGNKDTLALAFGAMIGWGWVVTAGLWITEAGSLGAIINRVFKGKKLPGRMGGNTRTMQNLKIVRVDTENNVLLIKGNVPGANKSFVTIQNSVKANTKKTLSKQKNKQ